jgi:hypothetical protein
MRKWDAFPSISMEEKGIVYQKNNFICGSGCRGVVTRLAQNIGAHDPKVINQNRI